jgi:uncharacterized MAPEG superfamily protein
MTESIATYHVTLVAYVALAALFLIQTIVMDLTAIRAAHVPGTPVAGGHDSRLFRATRAHANTNENFPIFLVLTLATMLLGASPWWTNTLAATFVASRLVHMLAYYLDLRLLRSAAFTVGLTALFGLLACAGAALGLVRG